MKFSNRRIPADAIAITILLLLWLVFFWRLFTPITEDRASLTQGDFSGQFVAFGAYQHARFHAGEVPLWNPYNNGGLPFIGDTQAAVFYPPRLLTIALSPEWSYNALQIEMTLHVLLYSLLMYLFIRRLTLSETGSIWGAFIAAVVAAYGGFISGYPPLQLALLEAAVWFPLAALGLLEATRSGVVRWRWLALAAFALGLSWLAGHPQTAWFLTYALAAFYLYQAYRRGWRWPQMLGGLALFGLVTLGVTAVTFLPGMEYLLHTARAGMGFDEKGNGFPFQDLAQFLFPGSVSLWSPLYVGIPALVLAALALWRRPADSIFWGVLALLALGYSFGANSSVFYAAYNILPGARFFRGQERAAVLVAAALSVLAGLGMAQLAAWHSSQPAEDAARLRRGLLFLLGLIGVITILIFVAWLWDGERFGPYVSIAFFSTLVVALAVPLFLALLAYPGRTLLLALLTALVVFELFSVNIDNSNYDSIPAEQQLAMQPPPLLQPVLADADGPFRVDGFRGLHDNYGSLYGIMDMRGISPLFLSGPAAIVYRDYVNNPPAWELFAVRYVFSDWQQLAVPAEVLAEAVDRYGTVRLHRLTDPRPFAHLVYNALVVDDAQAALSLLNDPSVSLRDTVILESDPGPLPGVLAGGTTRVEDFAPERFVVHIDTPAPAVLTLAHPYYSGWQAALDGQPVPLLRAYGALTAVTVPAGRSTLEMLYNPLSYRAGAVLSLVTWAGLIILALTTVLQGRRNYAGR